MCPLGKKPASLGSSVLTHRVLLSRKALEQFLNCIKNTSSTTVETVMFNLFIKQIFSIVTKEIAKQTWRCLTAYWIFLCFHPLATNNTPKKRVRKDKNIKSRSR